MSSPILKGAYAAAAAAATIAGGGWGAHAYVTETFAPKGAFEVTEAKVDYILDKQIESLAAQISRLEDKPNKNASDLEQLRWLRAELERLRRIKTAK